MFAEVIVRRRTRVETLTYAIPASIIPYIRVGSQVVVSVRRQTVKGVVLKITRVVSRELRSKLKDIQSVDKNALGFSFLQIATIEKLADYYGASLSEVAFHALAFPLPISTQQPKIGPQKPIFLQAPWPERLKFYQRIITKHASQKRLVFLFPIDALVAEFSALLPKLSLVTEGTTAIELKKILASNAPVIVVGGQKWAFFPLAGGEVLVIDQPDRIGLTSQRRPYLAAKQIGLARAKTEGIQLVLGADAPSVADYQRLQNRDWQWLRQKLPAKELTIFNKNRSGELLLPSFAEALVAAAEKNQKILVLAASRGWAGALYCRDCAEVQPCPQCGRPIGLKNDRELLCEYCGFTGARPVLCVNGHENLVSLGEGVSQVAAAIKKLLPGVTVAELSSDQPTLPNAQIIVGTEKILSLPEAGFDSLFVAAADQLLAGSSPDGAWHLLKILLALRGAKNIAVQTRFPDHWVWSAVSSGNLDEFYLRELEERKKYRLPPFGQELKLVGRDKNQDRLQKQADEIVENIETNFPAVTVSQLSPRFFAGQQELTLQLYRATHFSVAEKHQLRDLLPPNWTVIVWD